MGPPRPDESLVSLTQLLARLEDIAQFIGHLTSSDRQVRLDAPREFTADNLTDGEQHKGLFTIERNDRGSSELARCVEVRPTVRGDAIVECEAEAWLYRDSPSEGEGTRRVQLLDTITVRSAEHLHELAVAHLTPNLRFATVLTGAVRALNLAAELADEGEVGFELRLDSLPESGGGCLAVRNRGVPGGPWVQLRLNARDDIELYSNGEPVIPDKDDRDRVIRLDPLFSASASYLENPWLPADDAAPFLQQHTLNTLALALFLTGEPAAAWPTKKTSSP